MDDQLCFEEDPMKDCSSEARWTKTRISNPLAKEFGNDLTRDSPSQQGYGDRRRSVPELRAGRQALDADNERWAPRPESIQRVRGRSRCGSRLYRQGQGALQARAPRQGAQLLRSRPRRLVAASVAARAGDRQHRGRLLEYRGQPARQTRQDRSTRWRQAARVAAAL